MKLNKAKILEVLFKLSFLPYIIPFLDLHLYLQLLMD